MERFGDILQRVYDNAAERAIREQPQASGGTSPVSIPEPPSDLPPDPPPASDSGPADGPVRWRIAPADDPTVLRLMPALAAEIGLKEALLLLQLDHYISIASERDGGGGRTKGIFRDGMHWTYQSTSKLHEEALPFLSRNTINRTIHSLEQKGLIRVSRFNKLPYDRTRWFALNLEGLSRLTSIALAPVRKVSPNETGLSHDGLLTGQSGTRSRHAGMHSGQNVTGAGQFGTTIPETTAQSTSIEYVTDNPDGSDDAVCSPPSVLLGAVALLSRIGIREPYLIRIATDWGEGPVRRWITFIESTRTIKDPAAFLVSRFKLGQKEPPSKSTGRIDPRVSAARAEEDDWPDEAW